MASFFILSKRIQMTNLSLSSLFEAFLILHTNSLKNPSFFFYRDGINKKKTIFFIFIYYF